MGSRCVGVGNARRGGKCGLGRVRNGGVHFSHLFTSFHLLQGFNDQSFTLE